jgi:hypothetical protein
MPILEAAGPLPHARLKADKKACEGDQAAEGGPSHHRAVQAGRPPRQMRLCHLPLCRPHRSQMAR